MTSPPPPKVVDRQKSSHTDLDGAVIRSDRKRKWSTGIDSRTPCTSRWVQAFGEIYANAGATFSQNSSRERLILSSGSRSPALNSRTIPLS